MVSTKEATTFDAEMTLPDESVTESVSSSRARVVVIILAIGMLLLGLLGGWMLASDGDEAVTWGGEVDDATLADIDELLDEYWVAWEAGDGDAVVALMAVDGWFSSVNTADGGFSGEELDSYVDRYEGLGFTQEGPVTVIQTRAGYEVAGAERVDGVSAEPLWALDHFVIVDEDGQLRIASHQVISTV